MGEITSQPGNGSPGNGRSRPGMPDSRTNSFNSASNARERGYSASGSRVHSSTLRTERCDSDVEAADGFDEVAEQIDADGLLRFGRKDVENAAAYRILAHHFDGLAAFISHAFEMCDHVLHGHFVPGLESQRELAVELGRLYPHQSGCYRQNCYGDALRGEAPEADGALLKDFGVGREALQRQSVEGGKELRPSGSLRGHQFEKRFDNFG